MFCGARKVVAVAEPLALFSCVCVCVCVCVWTLWQDWIVWYTAVHVGVDGARHSRQVLLPDSFLNTTTTPPTPNPDTHTHTHTHTPQQNTCSNRINPIQSNPATRQPQPKHTHTHTHTPHSASCGDRLACLQLWACHMLMYSSTHSNWRSGALKYSPISLWPANGSNPVFLQELFLVVVARPSEPQQPDNATLQGGKKCLVSLSRRN